MAQNCILVCVCVGGGRGLAFTILKDIYLLHILFVTDAHKLDDRDTEVIIVVHFPALFRDVDYSENEEHHQGDDCEAEVSLNEALEL